jgi:hypothetical protein
LRFRTRPSKGVDAWVEDASRWTAGRSTRRSFLGKVGRVAVLVAAGPTLAPVLAQRADARVCGQTGYASACPTFDCDGGVWGWCWYASGCCAGGYLKKICDCCAWQYPNVQGYCDSGYGVRCLVESCGADPRVLSVGMTDMDTSDVFRTAVAVGRMRYPNGSPTVVLADGEDALAWAVALGVGGVVGGPVLPLRERRVDSAVIDEIRAMGASTVTIAGGALPPSVEREVADQGFMVERVGTAADPVEFSEQVARWARGQVNREVTTDAPRQLLIPRAGADLTRSVCVTAGGLSAEAAPVAAALAGARGYPLVIGEAVAQRSGLRPYLVGPEAAAGEAQLQGSHALSGDSLVDIALEVARAAYGGEHVAADTVLLAPTDSPALLALAGLGVPIVLHQPRRLDRAVYEWLYELVDAHGPPGHVYVGGHWRELGADGWYEVQSAFNGFETWRLVGGDGDGYPFEQPWYEQDVGWARVDIDLPSTRGGSSSTYWGGRARGR